ncbi:MAG: hypothetical protein R3F30_15800, partial [Planctomycetota bacterium]
TFNTSMTPLWTQTGFAPEVFVRTATGASSATSMAAVPYQNYIDLGTGGGASFARNDYIVIEDGVASKEEYLRIQWVEGDRLWFSSVAGNAYPRGLLFAHAASSSVKVVTLTAKTLTTDYTVNAATGGITEVTEFGTGNKVVVTYHTDLVMPTAYKGAINAHPEMGGAWGDWVGLTLESGTYTVGLYGEKAVTVTRFTESTSYTDASPPGTKQFLVGTATTIQTNPRISSIQNCYNCHNDIAFHGGHRRGMDTCLLCHGTAGSGDRPQYVAPNAPATPETTVDFRTMLHKIHHGKELAEGANYIVNGFGSSYPNNYTSHSYEHVGFPDLPAGTKDCIACHGSGNEAWHQPAVRKHSLGQAWPTRIWRAACITCHDADYAMAHMMVNTSSTGYESCDICHAEGKEQNVERKHLIR